MNEKLHEFLFLFFFSAGLSTQVTAPATPSITPSQLRDRTGFGVGHFAALHFQTGIAIDIIGLRVSCFFITVPEDGWILLWDKNMETVDGWRSLAHIRLMA